MPSQTETLAPNIGEPHQTHEPPIDLHPLTEQDPGLHHFNPEEKRAHQASRETAGGIIKLEPK